MNKKNKKMVGYALFVLLLAFTLMIFNYSHADSGWDTGYGGSSSSSSSSSRSSSSSSSSSSRSSSSSSSHSSSSRGSSSSRSSSSYGSSEAREFSLRDLVFAINMMIFVAGFVICGIGLGFEKRTYSNKMDSFISVLRLFVILIDIIMFVVYPLATIGMDEVGLIDIIFLIYSVVCIVLPSLLEKLNRKAVDNSIGEYYNDITEEQLKTILPEYTLESLKKELYQRFIYIQEAWMNFEYDRMKALCTDELFNTYQSQLRIADLKNEQNIMKDFSQKKISIYGIRRGHDVITVNVYLRVSFYDYVIKKPINVLVNGFKDKKITNNYKMEFVRVIDPNVETFCPNCNAKTDVITAGKCEYCGSMIVVPPKKFVLSKKTNMKTTV